MRFLISMVLVGMLALSSQAFADKYTEEDADRILANGKLISSTWQGENHHTRIIYKKTFNACVTSPPSNSHWEFIWSACWDFKPRANQ